MPGPDGFKEVARVLLSDADAAYLAPFRAAAEAARVNFDRVSMIVAARYGGDVSDHTRCSYIDLNGTDVVLCELIQEDTRGYKQGMATGGKR
jgi:hypothetical protein